MACADAAGSAEVRWAAGVRAKQERTPTSRFPSLRGKQTLRAALNEQDDEDEHSDLAEHGARQWLDQLLGHAEAERGGHGAGDAADPTEHHHHEGVEDVGLSQLGPDVGDLRERNTAEPSDPGAEAEGPHIDL